MSSIWNPHRHWVGTDTTLPAHKSCVCTTTLRGLFPSMNKKINKLKNTAIWAPILQKTRCLMLMRRQRFPAVFHFSRGWGGRWVQIQLTANNEGLLYTSITVHTFNPCAHLEHFCAFFPPQCMYVFIYLFGQSFFLNYSLWHSFS